MLLNRHKMDIIMITFWSFLRLLSQPTQSRSCTKIQPHCLSFYACTFSSERPRIDSQPHLPHLLHFPQFEEWPLLNWSPYHQISSSTLPQARSNSYYEYASKKQITYINFYPWHYHQKVRSYRNYQDVTNQLHYYPKNNIIDYINYDSLCKISS